MNSVRPLPPELRDRCFTVHDAQQLGLSVSRLRYRDLAMPSRALRHAEAVSPAPLTMARALLGLHPDGIVSHHTAALWWGLPLPARLTADTRVHLSVAGSNTSGMRIRRRGVVAHRTRFGPDDILLRGSWAVTSVERTFVDLAPHLSLDELVELGDAIVCVHVGDGRPARQPLSTLERLADRCAQPARGVRLARTALDLVRVGSDSPPETRLRLALVRAGLPEPELCVVVPVDPWSREVLPDLAYVVQRLSIQYDGAHHADPRQHRLDIERADLTTRAGWVELRISGDDLRIVVEHRLGRVPRAVAKVHDALRVRELVTT